MENLHPQGPQGDIISYGICLDAMAAAAQWPWAVELLEASVCRTRRSWGDEDDGYG